MKLLLVLLSTCFVLLNMVTGNIARKGETSLIRQKRVANNFAKDKAIGSAGKQEEIKVRGGYIGIDQPNDVPMVNTQPQHPHEDHHIKPTQCQNGLCNADIESGNNGDRESGSYRDSEGENYGDMERENKGKEISNKDTENGNISKENENLSKENVNIGRTNGNLNRENENVDKENGYIDREKGNGDKENGYYIDREKGNGEKEIGNRKRENRNGDKENVNGGRESERKDDESFSDSYGDDEIRKFLKKLMHAARHFEEDDGKENEPSEAPLHKGIVESPRNTIPGNSCPGANCPPLLNHSSANEVLLDNFNRLLADQINQWKFTVDDIANSFADNIISNLNFNRPKP